MAGKKRKANDAAPPNKRPRRTRKGRASGVKTLTPNSVAPIDANATTSLTPNFIGPSDTVESTTAPEPATPADAPNDSPARVDFIANIKPRRITRSGSGVMPYVKLIAEVDSRLRRDHADIKEEHVVEGHFDVRTQSIVFDHDQDERLLFARVIEQEGKQYFVAAPPVKIGYRRRVHFLIGVDDRKIYARKLVKCPMRPTEAVFWPDLEQVPRLVSCEQVSDEGLREDVYLNNEDKIWSIVSEYVPGQTLESVNKRIADERRIPDRVIWQFGHEALTFVQALRAGSPALAHKNLTPDCVLIQQEAKEMPTFKFIDFGVMTPNADENTTSKPEYARITRWDDAMMVALCMLEMMSVGMDFVSGQAAERMDNLHKQNKLNDRRVMYDVIKAFHQTAYDYRDRQHDWSSYIKEFKDFAETMVPCDGDVGQLILPISPLIEPIAYGTKDKDDGNEQLGSASDKCFFMGWYREVWVDPETFNFIGQPGEPQYGDLIPAQGYTKYLA